MRFRIYAAVYLILIRENKLFLLRRFNTGWMDGHFTMPSGHVEADEKLTDALIREAKEEAGITIHPENLTMAHAMLRKSENEQETREYVDFFFTAKDWEGEAHNGEPHKSDIAEWFSLDALPETLLPHVRFALHEINKKNYLSEVGWN